MNRRHSLSRSLLALALAALIWLPCLHLVYARAPNAQSLLRRQLALIENPSLAAAARAPAAAANPEWDLMGRTFVAWALANWALRELAHRDEALRGIDATLSAILDVERARGFRAFLLPYGRPRFAQQPERSLFVDSEIALTAALRRLVRDDNPEIRRLSQERTALITGSFARGLVESYPDEGWSFDHAVALAALAAADRVDGTNHRPVIDRVLAQIRAQLIDKRSGLIVSSFRLSGATLDGPEGSTLWMTLHCLSLVDDAFAREQYAAARRQLGVSFLGFGWAREWPRGLRGDRDIDSGPVVPLFDVSAGSSGLAFVGAASFSDRDFSRQLATTLAFAAFPVDDAQGLRYAAANQLGDAVLLYSLELGPAWDLIKRASP